MEHKEPRLEALRYIDNAKETLKKAQKENGIYKDKKYVRSASGTAYLGAIIALSLIHIYYRLRRGESLQDVMRKFPNLTLEQIQTSLLTPSQSNSVVVSVGNGKS